MMCFKYPANFLIALGCALVFFSCGGSKTKEKKATTNAGLFNEAKVRSQEIINSIGTDAFMTHFRDNPFFPDSTKPLHVHDKMMECGVDPAKLKYFDHFKEILLDTTEMDVVDFFYEGPCTCPDIRIMITFFLYKEQKTIQFTRFKAEPAAKPSDWIDAIRKRNAVPGR